MIHGRGADRITRHGVSLSIEALSLFPIGALILPPLLFLPLEFRLLLPILFSSSDNDGLFCRFNYS